MKPVETEETNAKIKGGHGLLADLPAVKDPTGLGYRSTWVPTREEMKIIRSGRFSVELMMGSVDQQPHPVTMIVRRARIVPGGERTGDDAVS